MPFSIQVIQGDITSLNVDAIVNSANTSLMKGSGLCRIIYDCAGNELLTNYIKNTYGSDLRLQPGEAIITPGFNLKAPHIIHTVTPKFYLGNEKDNIEKLSCCYSAIIKIALLNDISSIAIPCIGCGHHRWPLDLCASIAIDTILWLNDSIEKPLKLVICCYNSEQQMAYNSALTMKGGNI